jgi:nucleotidyltransferase substrate binding protein (TIGR01987 family)
MAVNIAEYEKALKSLGKALNEPKTDITRDASIQRFEFCVELAWKTARKVTGTITTSPKQVIREMAQSGLIDDVTLWLEAIDQRNLSSHTYNEDLAEKVYTFIKAFFPHAQKLCNKLKTP